MIYTTIMPQTKRERNSGGTPVANKKRKTQTPLTLQNLPDNMLRLIHQKVGARNVKNAVKFASTSKTLRNTVPRNALYTRPDLVKGNDPRTYTFPKGHMLPSRLDVKAMKERLTLLYRSVKIYNDMTKKYLKKIGRRAAYTIMKRIVLENAKQYSTIRRRDISMTYVDDDCRDRKRIKNVVKRRVTGDDCYLSIGVTIQWRDRRGVPFDVNMNFSSMDSEDLSDRYVLAWISTDSARAFVVGDPYDSRRWSIQRRHGHRMFTYAGVQDPYMYSLVSKNTWTQRHTIDVVRLLKLLKALGPKEIRLQNVIVEDDHPHIKQIINNLPKSKFRVVNI
jgi:hypothetical protein